MHIKFILLLLMFWQVALNIVENQSSPRSFPCNVLPLLDLYLNCAWIAHYLVTS
jgi:hypothetical protein